MSWHDEQDDGRDELACETCQGTGQVIDRSGDFTDAPGRTAGPFIEYMECPACHGTGQCEGFQ